MKKLIVTCTAVVYALAFVGCEDSSVEDTSPNNDVDPDPDEFAPPDDGEEGGGEEGGGEEGGGEEGGE